MLRLLPVVCRLSFVSLHVFGEALVVACCSLLNDSTNDSLISTVPVGDAVLRGEHTSIFNFQELDYRGIKHSSKIN